MKEPACRGSARSPCPAKRGARLTLPCWRQAGLACFAPASAAPCLCVLCRRCHPAPTWHHAPDPAAAPAALPPATCPALQCRTARAAACTRATLPLTPQSTWRSTLAARAPTESQQCSSHRGSRRGSQRGSSAAAPLTGCRNSGSVSVPAHEWSCSPNGRGQTRPEAARLPLPLPLLLLVRPSHVTMLSQVVESRSIQGQLLWIGVVDGYRGYRGPGRPDKNKVR